MEPREADAVSQKVFKPNPATVPMNVVLRRDAETAARVAYATGRRDAMLALAEEMGVLSGQFMAVDDMIEAITSAAKEFTEVIEQLESTEITRSRIIVPS